MSGSGTATSTGADTGDWKHSIMLVVDTILTWFHSWWNDRKRVEISKKMLPFVDLLFLYSIVFFGYIIG
jgi:hypothetical protein